MYYKAKQTNKQTNIHIVVHEMNEEDDEMEGG